MSEKEGQSKKTVKNGHSVVIGLCFLIVVGLCLIGYLLKGIGSDASDAKTASGEAKTAADGAKAEVSILKVKIDDEVLPQIANVGKRVGALENDMGAVKRGLEAIMQTLDRGVPAQEGLLQGKSGDGMFCQSGICEIDCKKGYRPISFEHNGETWRVVCRKGAVARKTPKQPPASAQTSSVQVRTRTWGVPYPVPQGQNWQGYESRAVQ